MSNPGFGKPIVVPPQFQIYKCECNPFRDLVCEMTSALPKAHTVCRRSRRGERRFTAIWAASLALVLASPPLPYIGPTTLGGYSPDYLAYGRTSKKQITCMCRQLLGRFSPRSTAGRSAPCSHSCLCFCGRLLVSGLTLDREYVVGIQAFSGLF